MKRLIVILCWLLPLCGYAQQEKQEPLDKDVSERVKSVQQALLDSIKSIYTESFSRLQKSVQDSVVQAQVAELQQAFEIDLDKACEKAWVDVEKKYQKTLEAVEDCKHEAEKERLKAEEKKGKKAKKQKEVETDKAPAPKEKSLSEKVEASQETQKKEGKEEAKLVYTENYWNEREALLVGDSLFTNMEAWVDSLVNADDSLHHYDAIIHDLDSLGGRISKLDVRIGGRLKGFAGDVKALKNAREVLGKPYNKAEKDVALSRLDSLSFLNKKQMEACSVDSLKDALRFYYLTTSNMMDLIQEIKDAHAMYNREGANEKDKEKAQASLQESFSIEARIDNFRMVSYMNGLYEEILRIVQPDKNGKYKFESFDMDRLEAIKKELEEVRQSNQKK